MIQCLLCGSVGRRLTNCSNDGGRWMWNHAEQVANGDEISEGEEFATLRTWRVFPHVRKMFSSSSWAPAIVVAMAVVINNRDGRGRVQRVAYCESAGGRPCSARRDRIAQEDVSEEGVQNVWGKAYQNGGWRWLNSRIQQLSNLILTSTTGDESMQKATPGMITRVI